ncbi:hypothetical protein MMC13_007382 [Lambiella insularis]|nr:hypothetical protein [Lambiella insularis]
MPFIPNTPETLISRSDSKNPSTTCKGITSSGKPCRRSLAATSQSSPCASPNGKGGLLAIVPEIDGTNEGAAAFFCWQHKEQAALLARGSATKVVELRERTSIDTLVDRLGVLEVDDRKHGKTKKKRAADKERPIQRATLPKQWQNVPGPLMAVPEDLWAAEPDSVTRHKPRNQRQKRANRESHFTLSFFCCTREVDQEVLPAPRMRQISAAKQQPEMVHGSALKARIQANPPEHITSKRTPTTPEIPTPNSRPPLNPSSKPLSETHDLLSLIPSTLNPQTTSLLLSELVKPSSPEPGYIYMFWLTPSSRPAPSSDTASSLLATPSNPRQRTSDVVHRFAESAADTASNPETLMLKIGRASNVQRRLNEWTRQCNYNLSLIRYYPYQPSSPASQPPSPMPSPSARPVSRVSFPVRTSQPEGSQDQITPRKVPFVHRVERLIHLELADKRVKRQCSGCGKEHREWFEVEASREGVRAVDEVVRRWVNYGEGLDTP